MLSELKTANKVIGLKQSKRAIKKNEARTVFVACDAEEHLIRPVIELCEEKKITVFKVPTMKELGNACDIEVGAAVVTALR